MLAERYRLTELYPDQLDIPGTEQWYGVDTVLGTAVRVLLIDPALPTASAGIDGARRSALIEDAHVIRTLSVGYNFVITELPLGISLAHFPEGQGLEPELARAIVGELSAVLSQTSAKGMRHVRLRPARVRVGDSGEVYIDGLGIDAALAGINTDTLSLADADNAEAFGLANFLATLLEGHDVDPRGIEVLSEDASLPKEVRDVLQRAGSPAGLLSPGEVLRLLAPWDPIDPALLPPQERGAMPVPGPYVPGSIVFPGSLRPGDVALTTATPQTQPGQGIPGTSGSDTEVYSIWGSAPDEYASDKYTSDEYAPDGYTPDGYAPGGYAPGAAAAESTVGGVDAGYGTTAATAASGAGATVSGAETTVSGAGAAAGEAADVVAGGTPDPELGIIAPADPNLKPHWNAPSGMGDGGIRDRGIGAGTTGASGAAAGVMGADANVTGVAGAAPGTPHVGAVPEGDASGQRIFAPVTSVRPAGSSQAGSGSQGTGRGGDSRGTDARGGGRAGRGGTADSSRPRVIDRDGAGKVSWASQIFNSSTLIVGGAILVLAFAAWFAVSKLASPPGAVETIAPTISAPPAQTAPAENGSAQQASPSPTPTPSPTPAAPPQIASYTLVNPDPSNEPGQDFPDHLPRAFDGDPNTLWSTYEYLRNPVFGGLKEGIGIEVKLAEPTQVHNVHLNVQGNGGSVQWRNTTAADPAGGTLVAETPMSGNTVLTAAEPVETDTVMIWFTKLPTNPEGKFRIDLVDVTID
ncbi:hypothetical protein ACU19_08195 [Actinobaculum suis]|uniref:hypothetical protein n=1 Tax=Actinobaculum suis TaxID=1657 RepID=UPI00066FE32E|nr:hypothetical protein [Actinobaculum suis]KMY22771.1 hypothetical protein ACU19_08195 [Actinobaculum suis]